MRTLLFALAILAVTVGPCLAPSPVEQKCFTPDGGTFVSVDAARTLQSAIAAVRRK